MTRKRLARSVPKSKTFTGCWTCRKRSVKCDTTRPICLRCQKSNLNCQGYDLKLYWVDHGSSTAPSDIKRSAQSLAHLPQWSYDMDQVDKFLEGVDQISYSSEPCPFTAFELAPELNHMETFNDQSSGQYSPTFGKPDFAASERSTTSELYIDECIAELSSTSAHTSVSRTTSLGSDFAWLSDDLMIGKNHEYSPPIMIVNNTWVTQQALSGHLLDNYVDNVTNLLQPIPRLANYYSAMYVPNAIAGSFSIGRDSSPLQNSYSNIAIYYSILATSAFHLSSADKGGQLDILARRLKGHAFKYLRKGIEEARACVESDGLPKTQLLLDKHRHAMAAMLTLVTADVMEGRMNEYTIHLDGIDNLYKTWRNKDQQFIFTKQQITIGSFLRILSATTWSDPPPRTWSENDGALFEGSASDLFPDQCTLEHIYGITPSLAEYMAQITAISQVMSSFTSTYQAFPEGLTNLCSRLRRALYSWSSDRETLPSLHGVDPRVKEIGLLHVRAFACALKVHFHTRILPCSDKDLAEQVGQVVTYLNEIEQIKMDLNTQPDYSDRMWASLTWPGFIASCEASLGARESWYVWWQSMLRYRIGNIAHLWEVVQSSWTLRDSGTSEVPAWAPVLRGSGRRILAV